MSKSKILNYSQLNVLFKQMEYLRHSERDRLVIALTFYTGMRIGEITKLIWSDLIDSNLLPHTQINFKRDQVKSRKPQRVLLSKKCRSEITRYLKYYLTKHEKVNFARPVILTQRNTAFTPNSLCIHINAVYKKVNQPHLTTHSGRKSFITALANKAVNAKVIMTLARHEHLSSTQKYVEINDEQLEQANELIG